MKKKNDLDLDELNKNLEVNLEQSSAIDYMKDKETYQGYEPEKPKAKKKRNGKKKLTKKQKFKRVLTGIVSVIVLFVAIFFIVRAIGKSGLFGGNVNMEKGAGDSDVQDNGKIVVYKGHKYQYNEDMTSILFMGIDRDTINSDEEYLKKQGAGQSDTLLLAAIDSETKKVSIININRDTMTKVKTYDVKGKSTGTIDTQICLAYSYGDGKTRSCDNTVDAVSELLYGMPINSYFSINLSAISTLNDAVGGVNVQVIGDLTSVDPQLKEGANVTLLGDQAVTYVRTREHDPLDANLARMQRQQQYIVSYVNKAIQETRSDIMLPVDLLNQVSENSVTNLSTSKITYLASSMLGTNLSSSEILSVEGNYTEGKDGYAQYHVDDTKLFELVLKVFYKQVS